MCRNLMMYNSITPDVRLFISQAQNVLCSGMHMAWIYNLYFRMFGINLRCISHFFEIA